MISCFYVVKSSITAECTQWSQSAYLTVWGAAE